MGLSKEQFMKQYLKDQQDKREKKKLAEMVLNSFIVDNCFRIQKYKRHQRR